MKRGPRPTLDKAALRAALARHGNSVALVAHEAGLTRQAIYAALKVYGIRRRKWSRAERSRWTLDWWARRKTAEL